MHTRIKYLRKGSALASFFICLFLETSLAYSQDFNAMASASTAQWRALLHIPVEGSKSLILDETFVSQSEHAPQIELDKGLAALRSTHKNEQLAYLCRFPARSIWIKKHYPSIATPEPAEVCGDFNDYLSFVPADKIELVYAYENVDHPNSMMGHVLLKLSGLNKNGAQVAHSVSFFTDIRTNNIPKLLFDTLVVGKKGYFSVSPYREQIRQYIVEEQRNVIQYEIVLDAFSRKLMQYHIWELKYVDLLYFFQDFNCATLTNDIIGLASASVMEQSDQWVSPLDSVKAASKANLLGHGELIASDSWKIRMLYDALDAQGINAKNAIKNGDHTQTLTPEQRYLLLSLDKSYTSLLAHKNDTVINAEQETKRLVDKWGINPSSKHIELSNYKNPLSRKDDGQLNLAINHIGDVSVAFIPISHQISDNNRNSFSESALELMSFKIAFSPTKKNVHFDDIGLYKMASFMPYNSLIGGWSHRINLGATQMLDETFHEHLTPYLGGGLGLTHAFHRDISAYVIADAQLNIHKGVSFSYGPEIGLFIYTALPQKTTVSYSEKFNQLGSKSRIKQLSISQNWSISDQLNAVLHYKRAQNKHKTNNQFELEIRYYN